MVSKRMSAIKAKDTLPELYLRKALWKSGIRGYRLHRNDLPGRPDLAWIGHRIAVFVHGCFWHRCPFCTPSIPGENTTFWIEKFKKNRERDSIKASQLESLGWKVLTIWECQIRDDVSACVELIRNEIANKCVPLVKPLTVIELFAGVGGFRIGLEGVPGELNRQCYKVIWSNQWEPSTKKQYASMIYEKRFGNKGHTNVNIANIEASSIPDADVLVGGFPCQDYSVASTLKSSKGLIGKKGVLWWEIYRILRDKESCKPKYLILENVDRLLKSPASQRGRDFAVMLSSLWQLGYSVEWRVIDSADYGMPQRRKRVFILGYSHDSKLGKEIVRTDGKVWLKEVGVFGKAFPAVVKAFSEYRSFKLAKNLVYLSENFSNSNNGAKSPFANSGIFCDGKVLTCDMISTYEGSRLKLGDILEKSDVANEFFIDERDLEKWKYLKGSKKEKKINKMGYEYNYAEGAISFPDDLSKPSRTIITGEGGNSPSRFKHLIQDKDGRLRRLTPVELERLNMFPDDFTNIHGISSARRAFLMGNSLVVGIIEKIGKTLFEKHNGHPR